MHTGNLTRFDPGDDDQARALAQLAGDYLAEEYARTGTLLVPLVVTQGVHALLLTVGGGKPVGFVSVDVDLWELEHIYLAPAYRRQGLGGLALDALMEAADGELTVNPPVSPALLSLMDARGVELAPDPPFYLPVAGDPLGGESALVLSMALAAEHTRELEQACTHTGPGAACEACVRVAAHRWCVKRVRFHRAELAGRIR